MIDQNSKSLVLAYVKMMAANGGKKLKEVVMSFMKYPKKVAPLSWQTLSLAKTFKYCLT
jgi:hypothetical protein